MGYGQIVSIAGNDVDTDVFRECERHIGEFAKFVR